MKIKHLEPDVRTLVNVNSGEVVLYLGKYYLCTDTVNTDETIDLVDIESGSILSLDYATKVSVCEEAIMCQNGID